MSSKAFDDFMKKVQADSALQQELVAELGDPEEGLAMADIARFAAGKGYRFDVEEVTDELSDEALEKVAGGIGTISLGSLSYKLQPSLDSSLYKISFSLIKW